ncbi:MAG: adenylyl-sulfate kinase [Gammaproteobacteria bacterium]|jgi:adenylylsulfate kinase|nr:adenylyl-sulfate kinase [Gammaproteobacteria bacterium]MBT5603525.1 adenylyl-sulfate kinase [Gammaproteobacteria bacterium]
MSSVIWLTGLSGSGKTNIAEALRTRLGSALVIDGDVLRVGLCSDLGYSVEDRKENARRVTELAKLIAGSGTPVIVATISPDQASRDSARSSIEQAGIRFFEVFVNAPLEVCEQRDVKGLYKRARAGEIVQFTGIDAPYDVPRNPDLKCDTVDEPIDVSIDSIMALVGVADAQSPHLCFVGRWTPFHKGHWVIMEKAMAEEPGKPVLVLVRDTSFDFWPAGYRKRMLEASFREMDVRASVVVIPDISSVNWGRGVGWTPREIEVEADIAGISATDLRARMQAGDQTWKDIVAPGVADFIEKNTA